METSSTVATLTKEPQHGYSEKMKLTPIGESFAPMRSWYTTKGDIFQTIFQVYVPESLLYPLPQSHLYIERKRPHLGRS